MSIFLGRQPILDAWRRRHGYELLYRSGPVDAAFFADPYDATRTVVEQALLEWGLANLVGEGMAFINVTSEFLQSGLFTVLPADKVVFELVESEQFDEATVAALREGVRLGYRFALDDLVSADVEGLDLVLPHIEIVKVEAMSLQPEEIRALVASLRKRAPHALLLAEKVETIESFDLCRGLGFELFQGYFFAKAEIVTRASRPIGQHAALVLMAAVQDPTITVDELADLANTDPSLAYRLLKLVNASAVGLAQTIGSVRQAIVLLGIDHVRQLATLLAMAGNSAEDRELVTLAVTRAHMAGQLLADRPEAASAFTAGLLSVIDVVFRTPMTELLAELPVTDDVRNALLYGTGPIGEVLHLIRAHEQADVDEMLRLGEFDPEWIMEAYGQSTTSAARLERQLDTLVARPG